MPDWVPSYGGPSASDNPFGPAPANPAGGPYEAPPGFDINKQAPWNPATNQQTVSSPVGYGATASATQYTDTKGNTTGGTFGVDRPVASAVGSYGPVKGDAKVDPNASVSAGSYKDADGKQTYGAQAQASTAQANGHADLGNGNYADGQANGPNAWAGATANKDTAQIGAEANVGDVSVTAGTKDAKSAEDESARFGLSYGAGAAARVHYGDADGDGHNEYGFGADIGPLSFDVKSEDPVRTAAKAVLGDGAVAALQGLTGIGTGTDANGKPVNVTDEAVNAAKQAGSAVSDVASSAKQTASDMWNWVTG